MQSVRPTLQVVVHAPIAHTWPGAQRVPHAPQLPRSFCRSRQTLSQAVSPPPQDTTQRPATHTSPEPQALPHMPQP
jgi:hypothetical protein